MGERTDNTSEVEAAKTLVYRLGYGDASLVMVKSFNPVEAFTQLQDFKISG